MYDDDDDDDDEQVSLVLFVVYSVYNLSVLINGPSPRPRGSARRKTASSLILRGHV